MADAFPISTHKRFKDLTGQRFGRWSVISFAGMVGTEGAHWNCVCDCGTEREVRSLNLRRGKTLSCGCYNLEAIAERNHIHGHAERGSKPPEYLAWENMRRRCNNPADPRFKWYGARGISVCERWNSFMNFLADMGMKPSPEHSIDRIDNDGNYEPGNCRWTTSIVQQNNRRPRGTVVRRSCGS